VIAIWSLRKAEESLRLHVDVLSSLVAGLFGGLSAGLIPLLLIIHLCNRIRALDLVLKDILVSRRGVFPDCLLTPKLLRLLRRLLTLDLRSLKNRAGERVECGHEKTHSYIG
jgi:hypothetical protein